LPTQPTPPRPYTAFGTGIAIEDGYLLGLASPAWARPTTARSPEPSLTSRGRVDRTPFPQKVIGESTPGEILNQLHEIDEPVGRFR
jgi:hypothetical protein